MSTNMFDDDISAFLYSKNKFGENVADSFGQSIMEKCYEPILKQFYLIKNCHEVSLAEETGIKTLLASLRLIL